MCAVHKTLHGTGSTVGTALCPCESPSAREGGRADPSALDFGLHSQPGLSCELDSMCVGLPVGWVLYLLVASAVLPKNELSSQWHSKQMCRSHIAIAYNLEKFKFSSRFPNVSQV